MYFRTLILGSPPRVVKHNLGFSLVSTLIAVGILGISSATLMSVVSFQQKEGKAIKQQLANESVKYFMLQTLSRSGNCSCQFNKPEFKIDTSKASDELDIKTFRSGCDFDSPDNIIAKKDKPLKGDLGVHVEDVKVSNIRKTGTEGQYMGHLTVTYQPKNLIRALRPIAIPLVFQVDMDSAPKARITNCWGEQDFSCYMAHINPSDGNTLAGCGGTSEAESSRTTAFGFEAGASSTGSHNVFIGHRAGRRHISGSHNIFIGPRAGQSLLSAENTLTLGGEGVESWLRGTMEEGVGRRLFLNGKEIATALHFAELEDPTF